MTSHSSLIRRRLVYVSLLGLFGISITCWGQQQKAIPIWPGPAPGSENWTQKEVHFTTKQNGEMIRNVVRPTITPFLPPKSSSIGTAIVVCPGGGFRFLSWQNEGTAVARWLNKRGITAFVLKYRLVNTGATEEEFRESVEKMFRELGRLHKGENLKDLGAGNIPELAADDGRQAMKVVREHASRWGIAPDRIGILGFSAGGMVADAVTLHHDAESRPDFTGSIYSAPLTPVAVPADAPPLFILLANDDPWFVKPSVRLFWEWRAAHKPVALHIYSKGGHGFGMSKRGLPVHHWIEVFYQWLGGQGMLKPAH